MAVGLFSSVETSVVDLFQAFKTTLRKPSEFQMILGQEVHFFCSAALITGMGVTKSDQKPVIAYTRIDPTTRTQGQTYEVDLSKILRLPTQGAVFENRLRMKHLLKERICGLSVELMSTCPQNLERGVAKQLCLLVFRWSKDSDEMTVVASAVIDINSLFLATIPNNAVSHQVKSWVTQQIYIHSRKHLFSVFFPTKDLSSEALIHCMHGRTFVPVTGNSPKYPGLYMLRQNEFFIYGYEYRDEVPQLFAARVAPRTTDGRSAYQFFRLTLT